jgi:3-carboxy-cis,cis-muconate cycloisomerase
MGAHIIDSRFLQDLYGTAEMRAVFDDINLLQKWLDVEAALARAEAEFGLIPAEAAAEISRRARAEFMDTARIKQLVDETVHPIIPLIRVFKEACAGDAGEFIHWGATTQDIMDTGMVLQIKDATAIFERRLHTLGEILADLSVKYRQTVMPGRTHGQQALPITFGYKTAIWLAEFQRHQQRLEQIKPRLLVGQLGGAVGTLASIAEHGLAVQKRMLENLGLEPPVITWHTSRDNFAEFVSLLGMMAATAGKIAHEVITLQRNELAEVEEPFHSGKIGSSTMPHKRNPMVCEAILALTRLVLRTVPLALEAMIQENERDWSCDHIEWAYLSEVCIMTDGALSLLTRVLGGLHVNPQRMLINLEQLNGLMLSEAVMLALGKHIGRQTAHDVVYECSMGAVENQTPFRQALLAHPTVAEYLSPQEIERLLDPFHYTGLASQFVDRVTMLSSSP